MRDWHAITTDEALGELSVGAEAGLSGAAAVERIARHGPNEIPDPPRPHWLIRVLAQLADPLVGALLVAAMVAALVAATEENGSWADTIAILLIVILNAALGFIQERRAEAALAALRKMVSPTARVVRDRTTSILPAGQIVPGDIVVLEAGDAVPADVRLIATAELTVDESTLTGESVPVAKHAARILPRDTPLSDRANMAYSATTVASGHARAIVVATGGETELGRIGRMLAETEREPTPLERRLTRLGRVILVACLIVSAVVFLIGFVRETQPLAVLLLTAVSLAVAAIPEGLPAITTITLALGMQRMAARGAIVRKLPAVETLGSATIICTDKTGTLTQNAMTVRHVELPGQVLDVTGVGYSLEGEFRRDGEVVQPSTDVQRLVAAAIICNNADLEVDGQTGRAVGDPTEAALLVLGAKAGLSRPVLVEGKREKHYPFDSDRKLMTVVLHESDGRSTGYVKGAPDAVLDRSTTILTDEGPVPLTVAKRRELLARNDHLAIRALRVLALAEKEQPGDDPERELMFIGLVAMIDPPRPEAAPAVADCKAAGIRVAMITGDHKLTARAIAEELGIAEPEDHVLTGTELAALSDADLADRVERTTVFARVTAAQKLRIVRALEKRGHVVAMTGDGVNDAPALKEAAIGVAMGMHGTEVARQAADMVLADDNFATIVHAVREGRAIFRNIRKFIFFLGSSNAGLVFAVLAASFIDWIPPLTPLQLLWINLVTNGLPALALGVDPAEPGQMREGPRPVSEGIVGLRELWGTLLVGCVMGTAALFTYWLPSLAPTLFASVPVEERLPVARTMAFTLLAIAPLFHAFNCRSAQASIATIGLFTNRFLWLAVSISAGVHLVTLLVPALRPIFLTHSLDAGQWAVVLGLAVLPVPVIELSKVLVRARARAVRPTARASVGPSD